jgi:hypothetical protein
MDGVGQRQPFACAAIRVHPAPANRNLYAVINTEATIWSASLLATSSSSAMGRHRGTCEIGYDSSHPPTALAAVGLTCLHTVAAMLNLKRSLRL